MTLPLDLDLPGKQLHTAEPRLVFIVHGEPIPQGSTKGFVVGGTVRITNDNPRTRPWRALVDDAARQAGAEPIAGPVALELAFTLARPKSRPARDRHPDRRPDLDKLARAVLDGLTGSCFRDDAQVVELTCRKLYVGNPRALAEPGLRVELWQVTT